MEKEVSSATWLAVSLISLAAFIGILIITLNAGNNAKNDAAESAIKLAYNMQSGEFNDLIDTCKDMPMASIYNLLTRNYKNMVQLDIVDISSEKGATLATTLTNFQNGAAGYGVESFAHSGIKKYMTTSKGLWALNGVGVEGAVMPYEILTKTGMLNGRGYIVVNRLKSETYKVTILKYK